MGLSLTQRTPDAHATESRDRLERLTGYTASQLAAGMIWLSGYDPRTFDAVLDAVATCAGARALDGTDDPEPICAACGTSIGIFLRLGLDWRHYRQAGATAQADSHDRDGATAFGQLEVFDPGHEPVFAWRLTGDAAMRL
jgi:hypothetical protein